MHEALDSDLRSDFGDPLRTRDMDIGKLEVPTKEENKKKEGSKHVSRTRLEKKKKALLGLVISANEIVHNIRVPQTLCYLFFIPDIPFLNTWRTTSIRQIACFCEQGVLPWGRFDLDRP